MTDTATSPRTAFGLFSILAGVIGWFASWSLLTEFIHTLKDPDYVPNCDVSILVTCGPNMGSWQGSVFGFSNTIIGVAAFTAPILIGVLALARVHLPRWFWAGYTAGLTFGIGFVFWLAHQSVFALGVLCPWCMVVWAVTIPLFWVTLPEALPTRPSAWFRSWAWVLITFSYLLIAVTAQVQLDWFAEVARTVR